MKLKPYHLLKSGYGISLLVHLCLLLILAIWIVKPLIPAKWHSFEWEFEEKMPNPQAASAEGLTATPALEQAEKVVSSPPQTETQTASPTPIADETPVLEQPRTNQTSTSTSSPVRVVRSVGTTALRSLGSTLPGGDFGFSANMEQGGGEAYIISQPKPIISPTEEGEVFVEFKLTPQGGVDANSINVINYSSASYVEAVNKAMRSWKFGFKGAYNPNRLYRIRCKFVINEN